VLPTPEPLPIRSTLGTIPNNKHPPIKPNNIWTHNNLNTLYKPLINNKNVATIIIVPLTTITTNTMTKTTQHPCDFTHSYHPN
jgi:hypothetical protein